VEELFTWVASLNEKDWFLAFVLIGVLSLVVTFFGTLVKVNMDVSRERKNPHTMSEEDYVRQLDNRTSGSRGKGSRGTDCTGAR
jgi:hypothetical protein